MYVRRLAPLLPRSGLLCAGTIPRPSSVPSHRWCCFLNVCVLVPGYICVFTCIPWMSGYPAHMLPPVQNEGAHYLIGYCLFYLKWWYFGLKGVIWLFPLTPLHGWCTSHELILDPIIFSVLACRECNGPNSLLFTCLTVCTHCPNIHHFSHLGYRSWILLK
jgi:hypothetical protein